MICTTNDKVSYEEQKEFLGVGSMVEVGDNWQQTDSKKNEKTKVKGNKKEKSLSTTAP